jgi:hypothetical protein
MDESPWVRTQYKAKVRTQANSPVQTKWNPTILGSVPLKLRTKTQADHLKRSDVQEF